MRVDTLNYKYKMNINITKVFQCLLEEQLKFFKHYNNELTELEIGTTIFKSFQTKTQKLSVPGSMKITQLIDNKLFQMETTYEAGSILQTYELIEELNETTIVYSEKNTFVQARNQYSFILVGLLYKWSYNRGIKKRMEYLEKLSQAN